METTNISQLLIPLISGILGVLVGAVGTHLNERWKRRTDIKKELKNEYAKWFTHQRIVERDLEELLPIKNTGFDDLKHSLNRFARIEEDVRGLLESSVSVGLMEKNEVRSELINSLSTTITKIHGVMQGFSDLLRKYHGMNSDMEGLDESSAAQLDQARSMLRLTTELRENFPSDSELMQLENEITEHLAIVQSNHIDIQVHRESVLSQSDELAEILPEFNRDMSAGLKMIGQDAKSLFRSVKNSL